jgi:hypothetical protein
MLVILQWKLCGCVLDRLDEHLEAEDPSGPAASSFVVAACGRYALYIDRLARGLVIYGILVVFWRQARLAMRSFWRNPL